MYSNVEYSEIKSKILKHLKSLFYKCDSDTYNL